VVKEKIVRQNWMHLLVLQEMKIVHTILLVWVHGLLAAQIVPTQRILFLHKNQEMVQIVKQQIVIQELVPQVMTRVLVLVLGLLALMLVKQLPQGHGMVKETLVWRKPIVPQVMEIAHPISLVWVIGLLALQGVGLEHKHRVVKELLVRQ
jgi:hypothetical protein